MGFAARVRSGYFGRGQQVQASTVSSAITAIGQKITLDTNTNPTKIVGSEKFLPCLQELLDGYPLEDPPTEKKLPVEADVPELLFDLGYGTNGTTLGQVIGDLSLIAFYYLLHVGEYTIKSSRNESKRTVQFKLEDITFFGRNALGQLRCLPRDAPFKQLLMVEGTTLELDNQKNGWKGVWVYQQHNGDALRCPVRAITRQVIHMCINNAAGTDYLSTYFVDGIRQDVTAEDISKHLKLAAGLLNYPMQKGIPIEWVDTHLLRGGGANALALSGYSDTQIQKMGRWRGATFKEYIREELANYSDGMSRAMKTKFNFMNVAGNAFRDITETVMCMEYNTEFLTAVAA
jgi:hypothetical protein